MTLDEQYRAAVAAIVARAPELSAAQRARLRALLAPVTVPKTRQAVEQAATAPTP